MMRKRLIAIALTACFTPIVAPQNTRAQVVESMVGGSACAASVGCGVIVGVIVLGGVAYYVLNANGRKYRVSPMEMQMHSQPIPQAGPRPSPRGDMRSTPRESRISDDETNIRGVREVHMAMSPQHCDAMLRRFRSQGLRLALRKKPNPMPGARKMTLCIFEGTDADPNRFADRNR